MDMDVRHDKIVINSFSNEVKTGHFTNEFKQISEGF